MEKPRKNLMPMSRNWVKRIHMHWTAGAGYPSKIDRKHYHFLVDRDGQVHHGDFPVEANRVLVKGKYAAHTLNANSGAIGVAVCGMKDANERPFSPGSHPLCELQIDAMIELVAALCKKHQIAVTRRTVLTHAEVQPTLGIRQNGKWDIRWLPGDDAVRDAIEVGDDLRERIAAVLS